MGLPRDRALRRRLPTPRLTPPMSNTHMSIIFLNHSYKPPTGKWNQLGENKIPPRVGPPRGGPFVTCDCDPHEYEYYEYFCGPQQAPPCSFRHSVPTGGCARRRRDGDRGAPPISQPPVASSRSAGAAATGLGRGGKGRGASRETPDTVSVVSEDSLDGPWASREIPDTEICGSPATSLHRRVVGAGGVGSHSTRRRARGRAATGRSLTA